MSREASMSANLPGSPRTKPPSRVKSWTVRIPLILQHLETDSSPVYTRAEVEALFQIGRSRAIDLMHIAGAKIREGAEATVSRDNLQYYIERSPEAHAFLVEEERKKKLAAKLRQTSEELRQRGVPIPGLKPSDEWTKWTDLPNVAVTPGLMQVVFDDQTNLIHTLWMISKAIANEPDVFREMCASTAEAEASMPR